MTTIPCFNATISNLVLLLIVPFVLCSRLLLDTGEADKEDYCKLLASTLDQLQARISKIIISHWHHDHLGGLPAVLRSVCQGKQNIWLEYLHN